MSEFVFDSDAATAYIAAAGQVADMLGRAADSAALAAGVDLSAGLGILGTDFATAWTSAWASQGETVRLAGDLVAAYGQVITGHGVNVADVDGGTATELAGIADDTEVVA